MEEQIYIKNSDGLFGYIDGPVPHLFYEREEYINRHPAIDHWIPPKTWEDVFAQRRDDAVRRHGSRCPITYDWDKYEPDSLSVQRMDINEREQREELNELI